MQPEEPDEPGKYRGGVISGLAVIAIKFARRAGRGFGRTLGHLGGPPSKQTGYC